MKHDASYNLRIAHRIASLRRWRCCIHFPNKRVHSNHRFAVSIHRLKARHRYNRKAKRHQHNQSYRRNFHRTLLPRQAVRLFHLKKIQHFRCAPFANFFICFRQVIFPTSIMHWSKHPLIVFPQRSNSNRQNCP